MRKKAKPAAEREDVAIPFEATRSHHSREAAEDYTELIADLIAEKGEARTCDVADRLGISHVTVIRTLRRLERDGYVKLEPRSPITLTPEGERTASYCKQRHRLLVEFLLKIKVPRQAAEIDVEGIEHHISKTTLAAIKKFVAGKA